MTGPERGWVYEEDGVIVYRASSLGSCVRSLVAARMGETAFPFHASIRAAMDASSGLEDELMSRGVAENISGNVIWQQKTVELPVNVPCRCQESSGTGAVHDVLGEHFVPGAIIRGHIDGLHQQSDTVLEGKNLSADNFDRFMANGLDGLGELGRKYQMQAAIYGHALQRRVRFVIGEKVKRPSSIAMDEQGKPIVTWKLGRTHVTEPIDPESLYRLADIRARIADIEDFAARDELPECTANCREGDPYSEAHLFATATIGGDDLIAKLVRFEELKSLLGSDKPDKNGERHGLIGEMEDIKDEIKATYGDDRETQKVTAGPFTVSVVPNRGRERIDEKWLRANHPDIAAQATVLTKPFRTLIVKGTARKAEAE